MQQVETVSVVVVGGGPAALSATVVLGRMRHDVLVVDGGMGRNQRSRGVAGLVPVSGISPTRFEADAWAELACYPAVRRRRAQVTAISGEAGRFEVVLDNGGRRFAERVLLATGVRDELPPVDGIEELWGTGVVHCVYCDGWELRDLPLAILITSLPDVTRAVRLTRVSDDVVACVHPDLELSPQDLARLDVAGVVLRRGVVVKVGGQPDGGLREVMLETGEVLQRQALFLHPEVRPRADLARRLGCRLVGDAFVEVNALQQTSVPGVLAAGDVTRSADNAPRADQVAVASAEGVTAGMVLDNDLTQTEIADRISRQETRSS